MKTIINAIILLCLFFIQDDLNKIDVFQDGDLKMSFQFDKDWNVQQQSYYENKIKTLDLRFNYSNGKVISIDSEDSTLLGFYNKDYFDFRSSYRLLQKNGIEVVNPIVLSTNIKEIATFLSVKECTEKIEGINRYIIINNIEKSFQFHFLSINQFIPNNLKIHSFELLLTNNLLNHELIIFEDGKFERQYLYDSQNRLSKIVVLVTYKDGEILERVYDINYENG